VTNVEYPDPTPPEPAPYQPYQPDSGQFSTPGFGEQHPSAPLPAPIAPYGEPQAYVEPFTPQPPAAEVAPFGQPQPFVEPQQVYGQPQQPFGQPFPQQPFPQPTFGAPMPGGLGMQTRPTSGLCIAGMILGILALIGFWVPFGDVVFALLGIGLSWGGLVSVGRTGNGGKGMAIAGLICGILGLIPAILVVAALLSAATAAAAFG
jgi:hypothetical protein